MMPILSASPMPIRRPSGIGTDSCSPPWPAGRTSLSRSRTIRAPNSSVSGSCPPGKAHVISNGADHILRIESDRTALRRFGLQPGGYILSLAESGLHKNLEMLRQAVTALGASAPPLIVAGAGNARVFRDGDQGEQRGTRHLGRVTDAELKALYTHAAVFAFPSRAEGFGLPPLEAMLCGCPVLAARSGAIPETCGEAALLLPPRRGGGLDRGASRRSGRHCAAPAACRRRQAAGRRLHLARGGLAIAAFALGMSGLIRDAGIALVLRIAGAVLWLLYMLILARLLSQRDFGLVLFAINLILIATPLATCGYETVTVRFGADYWRRSEHARFRALLKEARFFAVLGGGVCALCLLAADVIGITLPITGDPGFSGIVGLSIIASALMSIHRDALRSADRMVKAMLGFSVTRALVPLAGSIVLGATGQLSANAALSLYLLSLVLSVALEIWWIGRLGFKARGDRTPQPSDWAGQKLHLALALWVWPGDVAGAALMRTSGIVVGLTLGLQQAALFFAAERVAALAQFLADAVRMAAAPKLAQTGRPADQKANSQKVLSEASLLMCVAGGAGAVVLAILGWPLLALMGEPYTNAFPVLLVLLLAHLSWALLGPTALAMNMMGLGRQRSVSTFVAAGAGAIGSWYCALHFGLLGVAASFAAVLWALNGIQAAQLYRNLQLKSGFAGRGDMSIGQALGLLRVPTQPRP